VGSIPSVIPVEVKKTMERAKPASKIRPPRTEAHNTALGGNTNEKVTNIQKINVTILGTWWGRPTPNKLRRRGGVLKGLNSGDKKKKENHWRNCGI